MHTLFTTTCPTPATSSSASCVAGGHGDGPPAAYSIRSAEERGVLFIGPHTEVYEGMVIGQHVHPEDLPINICKKKAFTNVRAARAEVLESLNPPRR